MAPEVSTLDFANGVTMEGFRVPALSTRRTETEVELRDGQTFAISGLLDRNMNETLRRVPGIGDIPILGYLFRSQAYQKNNTELVVMITPHILRRDSPGVTPNLPGPRGAVPAGADPHDPDAAARILGPDAGFTCGPDAHGREQRIRLRAGFADRYVAPAHPLHLSHLTAPVAPVAPAPVAPVEPQHPPIAKRRSARRAKSPGSSASRRSETVRLPRSRPRARP